MGFLDRFNKPNADAKSGDDQSKAEMDALVERLGASFEEKIKEHVAPLNAAVTKLNTDWEAIKTEATREPEKTPTNADGTSRELTSEEKQRNAAQATLALAVQTNARLTEQEAIATIHPDWRHMLPRIREMFNGTTLDTKAKPDYAQYCQNVITLIIGAEAQKAGLRTTDQGKTFFLEDKSTTVTGEESPLSDSSLVWEQQKGDGSVKRWSAAEQLKKLGIEPKEFEESVKRGVV